MGKIIKILTIGVMSTLFFAGSTNAFLETQESYGRFFDAAISGNIAVLEQMAKCGADFNKCHVPTKEFPKHECWEHRGGPCELGDRQYWRDGFSNPIEVLYYTRERFGAAANIRKVVSWFLSCPQFNPNVLLDYMHKPSYGGCFPSSGKVYNQIPLFMVFLIDKDEENLSRLLSRSDFNRDQMCAWMDNNQVFVKHVIKNPVIHDLYRENIVKTMEKECPICMQELGGKVVFSNCSCKGKVYHKDCFFQAMAQRQKCPICQDSIGGMKQTPITPGLVFISRNKTRPFSFDLDSDQTVGPTVYEKFYAGKYVERRQKGILENFLSHYLSGGRADLALEKVKEVNNLYSKRWSVSGKDETIDVKAYLVSCNVVFNAVKEILESQKIDATTIQGRAEMFILFYSFDEFFRNSYQLYYYDKAFNKTPTVLSWFYDEYTKILDLFPQSFKTSFFTKIFAKFERCGHQSGSHELDSFKLLIRATDTALSSDRTFSGGVFGGIIMDKGSGGNQIYAPEYVRYLKGEVVNQQPERQRFVAPSIMRMLFDE